jgi:hypothetical protein
MNLYGNKAGYHTPEKTEAVMKLLRTEVKRARFIDTSWINDTVDSLYNQKRDICIYIPKGDGKYYVSVNKHNNIGTRILNEIEEGFDEIGGMIKFVNDIIIETDGL